MEKRIRVAIEEVEKEIGKGGGPGEDGGKNVDTKRRI